MNRSLAYSPNVSRHKRAHLYVAAALLALAVLIPLYGLWGARALTYAIPVVTLVVGLAFFVTSGPAYVGYVCWVWFLTPLVRRLVDYAQGYYTSTSVVVLSPILVSLICAIPLFRSLVRGRLPVSSPFVLALTAITMGYAIGVVRNGLPAATYDAFIWSAPLFVGCYIASNASAYPDFRRVLQRVFVMGGVVLGAYGVFQFINPPPWDRLWMEGAAMMSIGRPEPFMIRVFGPLNAPGPYAIALMVVLTMSLAGGGVLAVGPAIAGLLLSLVRAAWGGMVVGVLWFAGQVQGRERVRLVVLVGLATLLALPFLRYEPIKGRVDERADSLTALDQDNSLRARLAIYTTYGPQAVAQDPLGRGLGALGTAAKLTQGRSATLDSGIFALMLSLGIPGALLYLVGLGRLLSRYVLRRQVDRFTQAASAVVVSILALLVFSNQFTGLAGVLLWMCIGLVVCGRLYHANGGLEPRT